MINANASVNLPKLQKSYSWNPSTCIWENRKYLNHIADNSKIVCDEIINATDSVSANFDNKKVRYKMYCYILHTVLLVFLLLFIIAIICYHYPKHKSKLNKNILPY